MQITVRNGDRENVEFGTYSGRAGVTEIRGQTRVSFPGRLRTLGNPQAGTINGNPYRVLGIVESDAIKGMVVLTVEAIGDGAAK